MKLTKSKLGVAALAVGGVLAFAVPAGATVNLQSESPGSPIVKITKNAKLKANGAATIVTLTVTCPAGWYFTAQASVTQTVGSITTGGQNHTSELVCTGAAQKSEDPGDGVAGAVPCRCRLRPGRPVGAQPQLFLHVREHRPRDRQRRVLTATGAPAGKAGAPPSVSIGRSAAAAPG
ncbi:hypothetical protein OHA72_04580 [Dactylosporangium sp. NBC_01737]|uniref:hypothetical protein n=1 Tax=Dactylosporangium sp. NBC_01737 TaxID=2975959 RepID=UPI002E1000CB|nr:hypothetical protein OHA72_04580 [Dactylosporangium sp. NBC_01737]